MESITGYVDHIVFQNSENGYTVMILMMEGEGRKYHCRRGVYRASGVWKTV